MGIKSALTNVVARRRPEPLAATMASCDRLELRLAPYAVSETSIRIPFQREATLGVDELH